MDKKFCPKCKANTMQLADGIPLTKEEYLRVEDGPFVFKDKMTVYECSVCSFRRFEPKTAA
jgi:hypothetical protein